MSSASNGRRSTTIRWLSVPPDTSRKPSSAERLGQRRRVGDDLVRVLARSSGCAASKKATALPAMTCSSGPPCQPGNTALSIALACCLGRQDAAATRAAQRLVRRERDDVGVRHRVRVRAAGDEPGDVGGVEHQQRADLVGDRPERLGVEPARVAGGAGDDHLRAGARARGRAPGPCRSARRRATPCTTTKW